MSCCTQSKNQATYKGADGPVTYCKKCGRTKRTGEAGE